MIVLFFPGADLAAGLVAILVRHLNIALRYGVSGSSVWKAEHLVRRMAYYYYRVVERVMRED